MFWQPFLLFWWRAASNGIPSAWTRLVRRLCSLSLSYWPNVLSICFCPLNRPVLSQPWRSLIVKKQSELSKSALRVKILDECNRAFWIVFEAQNIILVGFKLVCWIFWSRFHPTFARVLLMPGDWQSDVVCNRLQNETSLVWLVVPGLLCLTGPPRIFQKHTGRCGVSERSHKFRLPRDHHGVNFVGVVWIELAVVNGENPKKLTRWFIFQSFQFLLLSPTSQFWSFLTASTSGIMPSSVMLLPRDLASVSMVSQLAHLHLNVATPMHSKHSLNLKWWSSSCTCFNGKVFCSMDTKFLIITFLEMPVALLWSNRNLFYSKTLLLKET